MYNKPDSLYLSWPNKTYLNKHETDLYNDNDKNVGYICQFKTRLFVYIYTQSYLVYLNNITSLTFRTKTNQICLSTF